MRKAHEPNEPKMKRKGNVDKRRLTQIDKRILIKRVGYGLAFLMIGNLWLYHSFVVFQSNTWLCFFFILYYRMTTNKEFVKLEKFALVKSAFLIGFICLNTT